MNANPWVTLFLSIHSKFMDLPLPGHLHHLLRRNDQVPEGLGRCLVQKAREIVSGKGVFPAPGGLSWNPGPCGERCGWGRQES